MTERPQQQPHRSQQQQPQQSQQQGLVQGPATMNGGSGGGGGSGEDEDMPELPADVDLQEQQMLMAAIQGGGYEGQLPGEHRRILWPCTGPTPVVARHSC
jgi:hypothetical protein